MSAPYGNDFFDDVDATSASSAAVVVPILVDAFAPTSVVDVGCGRGQWLAEFRARGVEVTGLDGDYVPRSSLVINPRFFRPVDLSVPSPSGRHDLALCLEVAEHLDPAAADGLVAVLAASAPVVVFSAAVPGQGGTRHLNEQWPGYWQAKFAVHGMARYDWLGRAVWRDDRIAWWYRQNVTVYATEQAGRDHPVLATSRPVPPDPDLEVVRVSTVARLAEPTVSRALSSLGSAVVRSVRSRAGR